MQRADIQPVLCLRVTAAWLNLCLAPPFYFQYMSRVRFVESSLRSQPKRILILSTHPVPDLLTHQIPLR